MGVHSYSKQYRVYPRATLNIKGDTEMQISGCSSLTSVAVIEDKRHLRRERGSFILQSQFRVHDFSEVKARIQTARDIISTVKYKEVIYATFLA